MPALAYVRRRCCRSRPQLVLRGPRGTGLVMRVLEGFDRARVGRLTAMALALSAIAGCFIGVSSAAAGVINTILVGKAPYAVSSDKSHVWPWAPMHHQHASKRPDRSRAPRSREAANRPRES